MRAVIIGAGRMAEAVLRDFATHGPFDEVTVADVDAARAEELARARGGGLARAVAVDAGDEEAAARVIAGHDVCASAAPYRYNLTLARAAIAAGAHFVDMGGNNDVVAAELALDGDAKAAGVTVVPDMGLAPGMTNVLAAALISGFDDVRDVHLRVGGLPRDPQPPLGYALVFSVYGLINEYAEPCLILKDGDVATAPPLTGVEEFEFPPLGRLEAFHTSGGSSTLPHTYRGLVRELDYKTIRYPGHSAAVKPLFDLGLASEEEVSVGGVRFKPRDVLAERLASVLPEGEDDVVLVRCWAAGTARGEEKAASLELVDYADAASGLTAMQRTTGFPVAVAAATLASGGAKKAGAFPPEVALEPGPFIAALRERGLDIRYGGLKANG
ncbi:MAG TPA: saccharopine dehydrogenase C-terminal domain-containing protein [bacterium]|nr:saccharopine dehydrogenase C-terminal domain-containing protein [bacterium]